MTTENWIEIFRIIIDLFKTIIPFGLIFFTFWVFKEEIKTLIKNGGLKVAGPGFSLETLQKQQKEVGIEEKKEIGDLNEELKQAKKVQQKLQELQEYTARDKDTFFLGYHLEKTYRLIFPSQMVILNSMRNYNNQITDALARALFSRTVWALQFNVSYEQFMGFLVQSGLISYETEKYSLTPLGRTFLEYLKNNNIPLKIPANDVVELPAR